MNDTERRLKINELEREYWHLQNYINLWQGIELKCLYHVERVQEFKKQQEDIVKQINYQK